LIYDAAGNAVGVVQGAADAANNGIDLQNGAQILGSALGLAANLKSLKGLKGAGGSADAATIGRRLGTVVEKAELDDLAKKLAQRSKVTSLARDQDAMLTAKKADALFLPYKDGSSTIYLKKNPTRYEILHELAHLADFESMKYDFKAWSSLSKLQREQRAYDTLRKSADWARFSTAERQDARNYIKTVGGKAW
jgi:hypothetical protein